MEATSSQPSVQTSQKLFKAPLLIVFGRQACKSPSLLRSWEFHEARVLPVNQLVKGHRLRKLFQKKMECTKDSRLCLS